MAISTAYADDTTAHEKAESAEGARNASALAAAMKDAKVSLTSALTASEKQGTPISAKFELEDGKLQLSVYTVSRRKPWRRPSTRCATS